MAFSNANSAHVTELIEKTRLAIVALETLRQALDFYADMNTVNAINTALNSPPEFPPSFNLNRTALSNALFALDTIVKGALDTAITAQHQTAMDTITRNIGVLTGTG